MRTALIDSERVKALKDLVRESGMPSHAEPRYTFDNFCKQNGLFKKGMEKKAGGIWIVCPFHGDSAPSLSYNQEKGIWHCFGCNAGGNYLDFIYLYETEVKGVAITRAHFMNNLLMNDPWLQAQLGFNTLFKQPITTAETLPAVKRTTFKPVVQAGTYIEFQEHFMKTNPSIQKIKMFILMMQRGVPLMDLKKELAGAEVESRQYSIEELEREV